MNSGALAAFVWNWSHKSHKARGITYETAAEAGLMFLTGAKPYIGDQFYDFVSTLLSQFAKVVANSQAISTAVRLHLVA